MTHAQELESHAGRASELTFTVTCNGNSVPFGPFTATRPIITPPPGRSPPMSVYGGILAGCGGGPGRNGRFPSWHQPDYRRGTRHPELPGQPIRPQAASVISSRSCSSSCLRSCSVHCMTRAPSSAVTHLPVSHLYRCARRRTGVKIAGGTARDVVLTLVRLRPPVSLTPGAGYPRGRSLLLRARGSVSSARPRFPGRYHLAG